MKVFLLDLWHDLKEKRLWPVAVVLLVALVAVPVLLAKPAGDVLGARAGGHCRRTEAGRAEAARQGQARRRRGRRRLDAGRVRPEQPVQAAEGRDQEAGRPGRRDAPAPAPAAQPARRAAPTPAGSTGGGTDHAGGSGGDPGGARHRRRRHHHDDDGLQVRGRPDLQGERPHAAHQGHGEARHAAEPVLAAADLHGRHAQGLGTRCSWWTRRSRQPARAAASRARPSAPSPTSAPAPSTCSQRTTATPTPSGSTRSARSRSAQAATRRQGGQRQGARRRGPEPPLRSSAGRRPRRRGQ